VKITAAVVERQGAPFALQEPELKDAEAGTVIKPMLRVG
jgi:hypothetical protein